MTGEGTRKEQTKFEILRNHKYYEKNLEAAEYNIVHWSAKLDRIAGARTDTEFFGGGVLPADKVGDYVEMWQEACDGFMEQMAISKEQIKMCHDICDELPPRYAVIMRMRYIQYKTVREIAKELNYSEERIKQLCAKARDMLNITLNYPFE